MLHIGKIRRLKKGLKIKISWGTWLALSVEPARFLISGS